jgi:hypothetical protein
MFDLALREKEGEEGRKEGLWIRSIVTAQRHFGVFDFLYISGKRFFAGPAVAQPGGNWDGAERARGIYGMNV